MKGFVSMVELISVIIVLIVAFNLIIPRFTYTTKWDRALVILKSRDVLVTADRTDNLYDFSFDFNAFEEFLDKTLPIGLVHSISTENSIKNEIKIACNCSDKFINNILNWFKGGTIINGRKIKIGIPCPTNLEEINEECLDRGIDVLIIEGDNSLDYSNYINSIRGILDKGIGVVELINFSDPSQIDKLIIRMHLNDPSMCSLISP